MTAVIVVPCFNEAVRWHQEYWDSMFEVPSVRWLFVDDGSSDATPALLDAASLRGPASVLRLTPNGGKAEAVRRGMIHALAGAEDVSTVGYMDADGAFNEPDVRDFLEIYGERTPPKGTATAVWSSRVALADRDIRRSDTRHYIGRLVATFVSIGQEQIPYDTQSGLKLFTPTAELRACLARPFRTRWLFELELLARWQAATGASMPIWEEPLNYWHDVPGSKVRGVEMLRIMRELAIVKAEQRKARRQDLPSGAATGAHGWTA